MSEEQRQPAGPDPDALAQQAGRLAERVALLGEYLDPNVLETRVAELEVEMGAGDFWDDQARAAKVSAEHARLSGRLTEYHALAGDVGDLGELAATAGGNLEAYASERIPEVLAERFGFVMESCGSESIEAEGKSYEFDAVLRGTINGRPVVVLCEVKTNISESEVRGFLRIAERVRKALAQETGEADVRPLFFGYRAAVVTQKMITSSDAWLVFPRGLVTAA